MTDAFSDVVWDDVVF